MPINAVRVVSYRRISPFRKSFAKTRFDVESHHFSEDARRRAPPPASSTAACYGQASVLKPTASSTNHSHLLNFPRNWQASQVSSAKPTRSVRTCLLTMGDDLPDIRSLKCAGGLCRRGCTRHSPKLRGHFRRQTHCPRLNRVGGHRERVDRPLRFAQPTSIF